MIPPSGAQELCSKSEWELVKSSFSPMVEMLLRSGLKSRLGRVRKLHRKTIDLISLQHSESRKRTMLRKTEMFAEAVNRFEGTLNLVERVLSVEPLPKDVYKKKTFEETRSLNMAALRERLDREPERHACVSVLAQTGSRKVS